MTGIILDPEWGYLRLDPVPPAAELQAFYKTQYYESNAPHGIQRMMMGDTTELEWMRRTQFSDVEAILLDGAPGNRVLDVGCGTGELGLYLHERGFRVVGTEPSPLAAGHLKDGGPTIYPYTLEEYGDLYARGLTPGPFDAVLLMNVLEHVPDPVDTIRRCHHILRPGGVICICVPNDFSELQLAAHKHQSGRRWWIADPEHVNYFNFDTLRSLLGKLDLSVFYVQGTFPMELFLLMGLDYTDDEAMGARCHSMRVDFEMAVGARLRRKLYMALAEAGVGRTCLVAARKAV